ncbi:uncharacterized protein BKCO1_6400046 [Diplodia corticola]|uniref:Uncharacterized protein n=1 Tax=Diplodia corticola TaxID=236234 RepID=A0A1J9QP49_9PEZI|nr:uncharacterized protein BKCO1_6400046 [Diplodia corticola]OJD30225.1 hypothetical protein BKCO1_6400046 [Diplodia corticola]
MLYWQTVSFTHYRTIAAFGKQSSVTNRSQVSRDLASISADVEGLRTLHPKSDYPTTAWDLPLHSRHNLRILMPPAPRGHILPLVRDQPVSDTSTFSVELSPVCTVPLTADGDGPWNVSKRAPATDPVTLFTTIEAHVGVTQVTAYEGLERFE